MATAPWAIAAQPGVLPTLGPLRPYHFHVAGDEASPCHTSALQCGLSVEPMQWAKAHFFVGFRTFGTMQEAVASKIEEIAERVAEPEGIEVVEVELKGGGKNRFVRISIDKPEGVTHADCEMVSQQVGTILDVEDVVPGAIYTLEVSSPGVERKLSKPRISSASRARRPKSFCGSRRGTAQLGRHSGRFEDGASRSSWPKARPCGFPLDQVEKANLKFEW